MQIPAIRDLLNKTGTTVSRFPIVLASAIAGSILGVYIIGLNYQDHILRDELVKIVMALYLAMVAGVACTIFGEREKLKATIQLTLNIAVLVISFFYFLSFPESPKENDFVKFFLLLIAMHALVAFAPFVNSYPPNAFWQYNKQLFLKILTAFFYSHALFIGIAVALLAIDNLFVVHFDSDIYPKFYILVMGILNTTFFLSDLPSDVGSLEDQNDYPTGLKIFTQFILLPLVSLYLLILYAYGIKIISTQEWPVGWVSYLVLGFSIVGILALLLVWPLRNEEKHQWIRTYSRFFFLALLPLIAMLFVAIGKRVMQYGVTENRYFILALAVWLLIMTCYFLFSKRKYIKIFPITLFLLCLISAYGPWSAFNTAEKSQFNRLKKLLQDNDHFADGKAVSSAKTISSKAVVEISASTDYLIGKHGLQSIQPLFTENLDSLCAVKDSSDLYAFKPRKVLGIIGITYAVSYDMIDPVDNQINLNVKNSNVIITKDFDYLVDFNISGDKSDRNSQQKFSAENNNISIFWVDSIATLNFAFNDSLPVNLKIRSTVDSLIKEYGTQYYDVQQNKMQFDLENGNVQYRLKINIINARLTDQPGGLELHNLSGWLLIRKK